MMRLVAARRLAAGALAAFAVAFASARAHADEAVGGGGLRPWRALLEEGFARDASSTRLGVAYEFAPQWRLTSGLALSSSLDVTGGWWRVNRSDRLDRGGFAVFAIKPALRLGGPSRTGWFGELGIGASAIAPTYRSTRARFSTVYQFGDHLEAGWRSSSASAWEVALRFEHFSNASIKRPNPGEGFAQLRLSAAF